jgi:glutamyl-tRNA(Gln) amidotransferase subunit E
MIFTDWRAEIRAARSEQKMTDPSNPVANREEDRRLDAYVARNEATAKTYEDLGFRCGLEIHQQLKTERKLFCRCPAGRYQAGDEFDAQLVRHMRPTLSELGEYDGTALMEFKTKKNIVYRIKGETACTYDIDDTPPFPLNRDALAIAMQIALLLDTSIVGELHITRKQYLDGSIPTGFQRTAIVGIDGSIPVGSKRVGIRQLSIEEDSCREVSDRGHQRIYTTDRLGMPLVETVTEPELLTPGEAADAADYLRYLARSTGLVNTGIGAAREDVNVSIAGGTRVEIKGVQHIRWIPELTHNEAFRQKALLLIRDELRARFAGPDSWALESTAVERSDVPHLTEVHGLTDDVRIEAIRLPGFAGLLSFFTSPGRCFADELSDRVKVVACIDKPNMTHSESADPVLTAADWDALRRRLGSTDADSLVLLWGSTPDVPTAIETIDERCRWAFDGVPNETRKALPDGTTLFERVLPGPDRMYPDTDSAPIPIGESMIEAAREALPPSSIAEQAEQLGRWEVPADAHAFILRHNLFPLVRRLHEEVGLPPRFAGCLVGHALRRASRTCPIDENRIVGVVRAACDRGLVADVLGPLVPAALDQPRADLDRLLDRIGYRPSAEADILAAIDPLRKQSDGDGLSATDRRDWIMGRLRPIALGNVPLRDLASTVEEALR